MTRSSLRRAMRRLTWTIGVLLIVAFIAKLAEHVPGLQETRGAKVLKEFYEFLRDMSLLIATGGVAMITNNYQRRQSFLDSLKAEWRDIIETKSALLVFTHKPEPTHAEYIETYTRLSETIDNMRVVYKNVGESPAVIGLYPYAPLHDMRRVLQTLDPSKPEAAGVDRKLARETMLRSFYALRERFLEELDLEEPDTPVLASGAKRLAKDGRARHAEMIQKSQTQLYAQASDGMPDASDQLLAELYQREHEKRAASPPAGR
jgi:hypothetical protein